jgi:two-component system response regulator RegA
MRRLQVLIAGHDEAAVRLADELRSGHAVQLVQTRAEAVDAVLVAERLDVVVVHTQLADGCGVDVARTACLMLSTPRIFVVAATPPPIEIAFELGAIGVSRLLQATPAGAELLEILGDVERERPPPVHAWVAKYVGHISLLGFEDDVREALLLLALERTGGNRKAAARLLKTSRQLIQRAVNTD